MSSAFPAPNFNADSERLLALLADLATGSVLTEEESADLDSLLHRVPQLTDAAGRVISPETMAYTVGVAVAALNSERKEPLAGDVRERLLKRGIEVAAENQGRIAAIAAARDAARATERPDSGGAFQFVGWVVAAASIALAAITYVSSRPPVPPRLPTVREQVAMLQSEPGTVTLDWAAQGRYKDDGVSGKVIWNNAEQKGFVRFKNLPPNDPSAKQYQLWIFDASRKDSPPVDAGVFDLTAASLDSATGEYVIPMRPALRVGSPTMVAVTGEKPGGVVVTDKTDLVAIAPVAK